MARVAVTRRRRVEEVYAGAEQTKPTVGTVRMVGQTPTTSMQWLRSPLVGTIRIVGIAPTTAVSS